MWNNAALQPKHEGVIKSKMARSLVRPSFMGRARETGGKDQRPGIQTPRPLSQTEAGRVMNAWRSLHHPRLKHLTTEHPAFYLSLLVL